MNTLSELVHFFKFSFRENRRKTIEVFKRFSFALLDKLNINNSIEDED